MLESISLKSFFIPLEIKDQEARDEKLMKAIIMFSFASFLFFFFVTLSGFEPIARRLLSESDPYASRTQAVLGVNDNTPVYIKSSDETLKLLLNNAQLGEGVLEFDLYSPEAISGAELYFQVTDTLKIKGIVCSSQFKCFEEISEGSLTIKMFRAPDLADQPLLGRLPIATIVYDESTYGELILNGKNIQASKVVKLGSTENLLNDDVIYLQVGVKPAN